MAISLYEASVASYLQTLDAVSGFMDRALSHFRDEGVDPQAVVEARLHPDMLPFRFQVRSVAHHSAGAVEAIRNGSFGPPGEGPAYDYAGLQALVDKARTGLRALAPEDIDRREGAEAEGVRGGPRAASAHPTSSGIRSRASGPRRRRSRRSAWSGGRSPSA